MGCHALATNISGNQDIIEDAKTFTSFTPADIAALAQALIYLFE
jgi:glycosyltransferase involved in cell wall biosynthesis